jgi:hypothetical protein
MNTSNIDPKDKKIIQLTNELKKEKQKVRQLITILNSISTQISSYQLWSKSGVQN